MKKKVLIVTFYDVYNENLNGVTKIGSNLIKYINGNVDVLVLPLASGNKFISLINYVLMGVGGSNDYLSRSELIKCIPLIESKSKDFDIIHFLGSQFLYLDGFLSSDLLNKSIVQPIDNLLIYKGRLIKNVSFLKKVFYGLEILKIKKLYRNVSRFKRIIFVSKRDARLFNHFSRVKSIAIENGISLDFKKKSDFKIKNSSRVSLVFHGDLTYAPNIEAVIFLQNLSKKINENYQIDVIGKYDENLKNKCDRLNFLGFVDDLSESLTKYDIYICPIFSGAGIKNKLLEASYMKIPVISTTEAAMGTRLSAGIEYEKAETITDFAFSISRLSGNELLRKSIAEMASYKVEHYFSWNQITERYEAKYNEIYINNNSKTR
ncbi:glycosyltransferase family 4 protein [Vibrio cholerae]|uniref:glycosyltransferase family 4 protein n=1 Tax=Vibrio cholerae TaxID=666 RepID=UPI0018F0B4D9|nr:glycosyltransferase family 4 protein [Vibrio cholerae]MBJ6930134.1 glycosyltransferase family 4 protein [Vibrio cholerae]